VIHHIATGDAIDKQIRYGLMPLTASNLTRLIRKQLLYHACFEVEKKNKRNKFKRLDIRNSEGDDLEMD
jgi:hypothetical protein